ncbi:MAG: hypothetical protein FWF43_08190 [Propionibacteriaceae bacterium]|nr:hypothetical protein [Propionibacteriaceae bacterium]
MIEIPEAQTLAAQLRQTLTGKRIIDVVAAASPHGFAWYFGDPAGYADLLRGRIVTGAAAYGGRPEMWAEDIRICFGDGVNLRFFAPADKRPGKHQLFVTFDDESAICATVQMYGGMWAFPDGLNDDPYYLVSKEKPSVLTDEFDRAYFLSLLDPKTARMSAKAFLATQQRIPGLGNGVFQDIAWRAGIHPKRKMNTLSQEELDNLYSAVKSGIAEMAAGGGRSTENDLFGNPGGYQVVMSRRTENTACPRCGTTIRRMSYLGGNVYVCDTCQKME